MTLRLIHEAGLSLWRARQRAALAAISISVGIAAVIAMVTIGKIVENETLRQFKSVGTDYFVVTFADTKILGPLDPASTEKFAANLPSVRQLVPFVAGKAAVQHGRTLTYASVLGVEERFASVNHLALVSGRQLHSLDHTKTFCVLGAASPLSTSITRCSFPSRELAALSRKIPLIPSLAASIPQSIPASYLKKSATTSSAFIKKRKPT